MRWFALLSLASLLSANDLENRVTALEQRKSFDINPPSSPVIKNGANLWIEADALYMHATEDGLGFGIKSDTAAFPDGFVKNINYDWSWGLRVGAGYNLPHDGWDLFLNWTWFQSHESKDIDGDIFPVTLFPGNETTNTIQASDAQAHIHLNLNTIDLELGREFFVSKWLLLRPYTGLRGVFLHRDYKTEFSDFGSTGPAGAKELEDEFHNKYYGIGLLGGFDTEWKLCSEWSIYGELALSLLYGNHRLHFEENLDGTLQADAHNQWTMVRAIADFALGLRWNYLFCQDRYRIRLQLGWEEHLFFGFNKDLTFTDSDAMGVFIANKGDLALSGAAFQVRFDF